MCIDSSFDKFYLLQVIIYNKTDLFEAVIWIIILLPSFWHTTT